MTEFVLGGAGPVKRRRSSARVSAAELAERTPASRDRYVDFLRAASIVAVVFGHWFIALIWRQQGYTAVYSAIGVTSGLWVATWIFQVIPIFFFVGGFSNLVTYEAVRARGETTSAFLRSRAVRLLKPTALFIGAWLVLEVILHLVDAGGTGLVRGVRLGNTLPFGPLWFLLVYFVVVMVSPITSALHRRFGALVPGVMVGGAILVDTLAFGGGVEQVRWLNLGLVWLLAHQLGYFYADGSLPALPRRAHVAMALSGLAALGVLTNIGVYPRSMLGTDAAFFHLRAIEKTSNMNPPTLCIVALTFWLVGLAMVVRDPLTRWLQRVRPWTAVIVANGVIMTLFLWHMSAYFLAILLLWPLGLGHELDSTSSWWLQRPAWEIVPAAILLLVVALVGRFERPASRRAARES